MTEKDSKNKATENGDGLEFDQEEVTKKNDTNGKDESGSEEVEKLKAEIERRNGEEKWRKAAAS